MDPRLREQLVLALLADVAMEGHRVNDPELGCSGTQFIGPPATADDVEVHVDPRTDAAVPAR